MTRNTWPDVPASSHAGGSGISFADSHVEIRKWLTPHIKVPVVKNDDVHNIEAGQNNPDYLWFTLRSTCLSGR